MAFRVACHGCGQILYQERDMIPLHRLRAKCNGRCSECGRKLSISPQSIMLEPVEESS